MDKEDSEQESEESETEEEEEEQEEEEPALGEIHVAQVHTSATRVSTQPRSRLAINEGVLIDPQYQTIIVIKKKEADKHLLQFQNLKKNYS